MHHHGQCEPTNLRSEVGALAKRLCWFIAVLAPSMQPEVCGEQRVMHRKMVSGTLSLSTTHGVSWNLHLPSDGSRFLGGSESARSSEAILGSCAADGFLFLSGFSLPNKVVIRSNSLYMQRLVRRPGVAAVVGRVYQGIKPAKESEVGV